MALCFLKNGQVSHKCAKMGKYVCKNGQICVQKRGNMCAKMGKYVCKNGQICVGGNGKDYQAKRKKIAETVPDKEGHKKRNDDYNRSFNVKKKL